MSQPLLATHRTEIQYVVDGLMHRYRAYCSAVFTLGNWTVADRDGVLFINWGTLAAQKLWDAIRGILVNTTPAATATLQERSGLLWNPVDAAALLGAGQQAPASDHASEMTAVIRDTSFFKIRSVILEHSFGYIGHSADGTSLGSAIATTIAFWSGANTDPSAPYRWQKSRGNRFIKGTGMVAGVTMDLNDKLKRRRGLE